jgi:hypothetical protein
MGSNSEIVVASQDAYSVLGNFSLRNSWSWLMRLQIKILPPLLWKIFAESRAGNICVLDCYTEILHAGRQVVKLCSIFRVPESRAVMMSLKLLQCCWLIAYLYLQYVSTAIAMAMHVWWLFFLMCNSYSAGISHWSWSTNFLHGNSLEWRHKVLLVADKSYNDA